MRVLLLLIRQAGMVVDQHATTWPGRVPTVMLSPEWRSWMLGCVAAWASKAAVAARKAAACKAAACKAAARMANPAAEAVAAAACAAWLTKPATLLVPPL